MSGRKKERNLTLLAGNLTDHFELFSHRVCGASLLLPSMNLGEGNTILEEESALYFGQTDFETFTQHLRGVSRKLRGEVSTSEKRLQSC